MKKRKTYEISVIDKTYSKIISDETKFYTSDTALELGFELKETEYTFESAEIVLLNIDDCSLVTRLVAKSLDSFTYELEDDIIAHYGEWRGQLRFEQAGEIYVSSPVKFRIENDLSNDRPPQLSDVQSWVSLKRYADGLVDELKQAVLSVEGIEDTFNANETVRQTTFVTAEQSRQTTFTTNEASRTETFNANEATRQENEDTRIEAEKQREETVTNIETRQTFVENQFNAINQELTTKDVISAPEIIAARGGLPQLEDRLNETDAQLAQTENKLDSRIDNIISTPTTVSEQEIIDARDGENSLGANLRNKAENVILKNQIKNGNFKNPVNFETDWNRGNSDGTLITSVTSEGQLSVESTEATATNYLNSKNLDLRSGDKYYFKYDILENLNGALVRVQCFDANGTILQPSIAHENSIGTHSATGVALENTAFAQLNFSVVQAGRKLIIDNIVFFNLTLIFGAGNEPTTDDVDRLINNYPEGYIEGGVTLWDMRDTNQAIKEIRQSLNPSAEKLGDISKATKYSPDYEIQDIEDYYRHINNGDFNAFNFFRQTGLESILSGHKYLIDITARSFPRTMRVGFGNSETNSFEVSPNHEFTQVRKVLTATTSYTNFGGYMMLYPQDDGHYIDIKKDAGFYDLTEFFGEGSEPTQAELDEVVNLYPNADTETLLFKLLNEENSILRDELKKVQVAFNNHKDRNKIDFNEVRAEIAGLLYPDDNTGYYYRGKPAPSILVGDKALSYESFMANTWELLREENPEYITRNTIIKDTSGAFDIYEYVFEPENYTKTVFFIGGVHGDEYEAFWGLYYFMKKIVEDTDNHERMSSLKDNIRFVIIPIVNPWGVERQTRGNSRGINTNHNYDVTFGVEGYVSEGSAPFSENESKAVKMIAEKYDSPFDLFIDFHTDPYSPRKGNYITIVESSILWDTGVQITLDEIAYLNETYNFVTDQRPAIVNVSTGNGAWRYMELIKNVPSLIWETSVGRIAETGTSKMMTIAMDWMINVFTEMLKVE